ncbi:MAG TPA: tagaturonate epimerase family protein [Anaerolineales bacterium]|nr:tagaturonate epimerase family protein [Anaerolineales bacterium]
MAKLETSTLDLHPNSISIHNNNEFGLVKTRNGNRLAILSKEITADFEGEQSEFAGSELRLCPLTSKNAMILREQLAWLYPSLIGLKTSVGMGDRLGLATPGHIRALRAVGGSIAPIFAQQSIRENRRTGRNPQQVLDDVTWGMFQEGWRGGTGADADHLKTTEDIDSCLEAGYSFFTIDPGDHVDNRAEHSDLNLLRELAEQLPDDMLPINSVLKGSIHKIEDLTIAFDEFTLLKAAVKYGKAVHHVANMYHYLKSAAGSKPFEFEVSVDETDEPTTHAEHVYIAHELKRMGVDWVSMAPRYIGSFEKGVDYIGDIHEFENSFSGHAAIARKFGPYKLSLHSGSDKFSIYPIAMRLTKGLVHLKTAGTSYLEALRTIANHETDLFREIYRFARGCYEIDRLSYHVSAEVDRSPQAYELQDPIELLDQFDEREILHVTFGSVLNEMDDDHQPRFYSRLMDCLKNNSDEYASNLTRHFVRHIRPFISKEG